MHVLVYISANISFAPCWMFQKPYLTVFVADNSIGQVLFYHAQALIHSNCCCGFSSGGKTSSTYLLYLCQTKLSFPRFGETETSTSCYIVLTRHIKPTVTWLDLLDPIKSRCLVLPSCEGLPVFFHIVFHIIVHL